MTNVKELAPTQNEVYTIQDGEIDALTEWLKNGSLPSERFGKVSKENTVFEISHKDKNP